MSESTRPSCQRCGSALPAAAPGDLCPGCVMGGVVDGLDSTLGEAGTTLAVRSSPLGSDPLEGSTLGPGGRYKILQAIGEGGFGNVYMAEQSKPVKRRVAIKVLKAGMDTRQVIARFEAERQALAMMDHPNIAKVLDGGETEHGRPFFVMELVRGTPITSFCDREKLPPKERLNLFIKVCRAVQHAHQKGIIHRDLKPSNILVTIEEGAEPVPKVIDFGVAKAMEANLTDKTLFTRFEQMIGTPAYMSPEQAGTDSAVIDIDTRADIYALGVLLYELLTGTTPIDSDTLQSAAFDEVRRILREDEAPRPSARLSSLKLDRRSTIANVRGTEAAGLGKQLRGDLDWIVMKAIEKDRRRRYDTANALAADVERHLADEPVRAGPPTASYRLSKFFRRNKAGVGIVTGVVLSLLAGLTLAAIGFSRAKQEAKLARESEGQARDAELEATRDRDALEAIQDFLSDDLLGRSGSHTVSEPDLTMRTALDRAAEQIDQRFANDPLARAEVHQIVGSAYLRLGIGPADTHIRECYHILKAELPSDDPKILRAQSAYAGCLGREGDRAACLVLLEDTLQQQKTLLGETHHDTLDTTAGYLRWRAEEPDAELVTLARQYVALREQETKVDLCALGRAKAQLADVLSKREAEGGNSSEVSQLFKEAITHCEHDHGADHLCTLSHKQGLAEHYTRNNLVSQTGRRELYLEVARGYEAIRGTENPNLTYIYRNLGAEERKRLNFEEAELLGRRALKLGRLLDKKDPNAAPQAAYELACSLSRQNRFQEAYDILEQSVRDQREKSYQPDEEIADVQLTRMAKCLLYQGQFAEAERLVRPEIERRLRKDGLRILLEQHALELLLVAIYEQRGLDGFEAAIFDLAKLDASLLSPQDTVELSAELCPDVLIYAARLSAHQGRWAEARTRFDFAAEVGSRAEMDSWELRNYGLTLLASKDQSAFREHCSYLLKRFRNSDDKDELARTIHLNYLVPSEMPYRAPAEGKVLEEMLERLRSFQPRGTRDTLAAGLGLLRIGEEISTATMDLHWCLKYSRQGYAFPEAASHALLAITHAVGDLRGDFRLARERLADAESLAERMPPGPSDLGESPYSVWQIRFLLEEARAAIAEMTPKTEIVPRGSTFSYLAPADGVDPAKLDPDFHESFFLPEFDDSAWETGVDHGNGFGYGDPVDVEWPTPAEGQRKTAYLRHRFTVEEPMVEVIISTQCDDGAIVYLDGIEAQRLNIVASEVERFDLMAGSTVGWEFEEIPRAGIVRLSRRILEPGDYVLAFSLHNRASDSSDLRLADIRLLGTPLSELSKRAEGIGVSSDVAAKAKFDLMKHYASLGDWTQAKRYALDIDIDHQHYPDVDRMWEMIHGLILLKLGKRDAYARHCRVMLDRHQGSSDAGTNDVCGKLVLTDSQARDSAEFERALAHADKAVEKDPENAWNYLCKGMAKLRAGTPAEALVALKSIEDEDASWRTAALAMRAMASQQIGDQAEAMELMKEARAVQESDAMKESSWWDVLVAEMLMDEASELIEID